MASLDSQIDSLYQKPLDEFTSARNALAKTLTGADAARVRKLPKPTVVPWAVNQLYWQARGVFDRLRTTGERLRAQQIAALKGRAGDIRAASEAQREAIAEAVRKAIELASPSGSHPNRDELTRTLEALSLAAELPEAPGRLTRALQPAGFEALAGVTPVVSASLRPQAKGSAPSLAKTSRHGEASRRVDADHRRAEREEKARRESEEAKRRAKAELDRAEAVLDRAKATAAQARIAWERAKDQIVAAERAVADATRKIKP